MKTSEPPLKKAKLDTKPIRYNSTSTANSELVSWDDPARGVWGMSYRRHCVESPPCLLYIKLPFPSCYHQNVIPCPTKLPNLL